MTFPAMPIKHCETDRLVVEGAIAVTWPPLAFKVSVLVFMLTHLSGINSAHATSAVSQLHAAKIHKLLCTQLGCSHRLFHLCSDEHTL